VSQMMMDPALQGGPPPGGGGDMAGLMAALQGGGGAPGGPPGMGMPPGMDPGMGGGPPGMMGDPMGDGGPGGLPPELLQALMGAGGGGDMGDPGGGPDQPDAPMSATDHIQQAMKHLMMAMTQETDHSHGAGIAKGIAGLQGVLAGKAKLSGIPAGA